MIRIAHASDLHCSERHRLDDWKALHGVFVEQMEEAKVNLILLAGDLFHARSTPAERNAMAEFLIAASRVAPVVIAKGNHDAAGDLDIFGRLGGDARVTVMDRPGVERIWPVYGRAGAAGSSTRVIALPWFDKAHLVAGLDATQDAQTTANATVDAARSLLTTLRAHASEARAAGDIPILVGHVMLGGSVVSTGQVLIGQGVELSPSDILDVGCEYAALGHIHKAQSWFAGRVAYSGSTWRQNFGEAEPKGWRLVTFDDEGKFAGAEFMELPARNIVLIEADFTRNERIQYEMENIPGSLVRVRYLVAAEKLHEVDEAHIREQLLSDGAHEVTLEAIVEHQARVRSELIVEAKDSWSKIEAWLTAKEIAIDEPTRERIRAKLSTIETAQARDVTA